MEIPYGSHGLRLVARFFQVIVYQIQVSSDKSKISVAHLERCFLPSTVIDASGLVSVPYDLENYLVPGINRYASVCDIVTNMIGALSDNGVPGDSSK